MPRAASATIYDPDDLNSTVAQVARCDILLTVFSNEIGTWAEVMGSLWPLSGQLPYYAETQRADFLALEVDCLYWDEYAVPSHIRNDLYRTLRCVYRETCLKNAGPQLFSLLLRYLSFCHQYHLDPNEVEQIYEMVGIQKIEGPEKTVFAPFRFSALDWYEYLERFAAYRGSGDFYPYDVKEWFWDSINDEYLTYQYRIDLRPVQFDDERIHIAQNEAWADYKDRRDQAAEERGLKFANTKQGHSKERGKDILDPDYLIYLYLVKLWGTDKILRHYYPDDPDDHPENANRLARIERAISRRLKVAHVPFLAFGKKRDIDKELAELGF